MSEVYHLPRGTVAYNTLTSMLIGYLKAGADQKYVGSGEAAEKLGIAVARVSRNVNFFVDFDFLQREEGKSKGGCQLTSETAEFAAVYNISPNVVTTRQKLGKILQKHQVVDTCLKRLASGKLTSEEFYPFILTQTGDRKAKINNLDIFTDLLVYATLLKRDDDYFALPKEGEVPELPRKVPVVSRKGKKKTRVEPKKTRRTVRAPIWETQFPPFLISLTPDTPRNKIKEIVTAVLEAIDEYQKKVGKK